LGEGEFVITEISYAKSRTSEWSLIRITGLALLAIAFCIGCQRSQRAAVEQLLSDAKLSALPPSATNVQYFRWTSGFGGETYAKVELSSEEIEKFTSNSPGLQGIKPEKYSSRHQLLPRSPASDSLDNEYFDVHPKFPNWFNPVIPSAGSKYVIPWGPDLWIVIDDDKHIVWFRLIKG
jgi:hypothetical protein